MPRTSNRLSGAGVIPQPGIQSFARATKPGVSLDPTTKPQKEVTAVSAAPSLHPSPSKKRKLTELENVGGPQPQPDGGDQNGRIEEEEQQQQQQKEKAQAQDEVNELDATPSKVLRFNDLTVESPHPRSGHRVLARSSPSVRSQLRSTRGTVHGTTVPDTPSRRGRTVKRATAPRSQSQPQLLQTTLDAYVPRPACLDDFLRLHSSFLKALTLHSAHNGAAAAADLRDFLRSVERIWRKRKVVVKDLQRIVWVWEQAQLQAQLPTLAKGAAGVRVQQQSTTSKPVFRLANYGLGRVCLERVATATSNRTDQIDETEWQEQFEQTLDLLWEKALDSGVGKGQDRELTAVQFLENMGLSPVHESLTPLTSFRKGQQRLQDLKGGIIRMKMEKFRAGVKGASKDGDNDNSDNKNNAAKPAEAAPSRRKGLLDRIKNKELRQSTLPPPPSKDMLARQSAVERVEDVASVLASLRPAGYVGSGIKAMLAAQRKPFQIPVIVQHVQDSVRNPISKQEVEVCLEVLARTDVAGAWVNLVPVNKVNMVVLKSCADVNPKELGAKAASLKIDV